MEPNDLGSSSQSWECVPPEPVFCLLVIWLCSCCACTFLGWAATAPATPALHSLRFSPNRREQVSLPVVLAYIESDWYIEITTTVPKRSGIYRSGLKLTKPLGLPKGRCMLGCQKLANYLPWASQLPRLVFARVLLRDSESDSGNVLQPQSEQKTEVTVPVRVPVCQWSQKFPLIWLPGVGVSTNPHQRPSIPIYIAGSFSP